jgi:oxygen-independent coproporphyrinogen III oxidase
MIWMLMGGLRYQARMLQRSDLLHARVPRYTSYPTAPHFHAGVNADMHRLWLSALPKNLPLSLYLHVPFCDTLCWFCGCHTHVVNRYSPVSTYLGALLCEIATVAAIIGPDHPVSHIHWGGGSPTMLSPADIAALAAAVRAAFCVSDRAEFAVEIDPRGLTDETIAALAAAGLTRASIGVQDLDETVQRAINRVQPHEVTRSAVERLRAAGIAAINIDLVYGLPHQTESGVAQTIERTLELEPQRFAVFGYAHVPHFKKHMNLIKPETLPDAAARLAQFELAHRLLSAAGYVPIGLDHFALPDDGLAKAQAAGTLARNFQGYTDDAAPALIGLGASSISALPQGYVQNVPDVPEYRKAVEANMLATIRGVALSDDDVLRRAIIARLMCDLSVDLDAIARPFGKSAADFRAELDRLVELQGQGYVEIDGARIAVPAAARYGVRLVAAAFDRYLHQGGAIHSVAV